MIDRNRNSLDDFIQGSNTTHFVFLKFYPNFFVDNRLLRIRVDAERFFRRLLELCTSVMIISWGNMFLVYFVQSDLLVLVCIHDSLLID